MQTHNFEDLSVEECVSLIGKTVLVTVTNKTDPKDHAAMVGRLVILSEDPNEVRFAFDSAAAEPAYIRYDPEDAEATVTFEA